MPLKDLYNLAVADSAHRATIGGAIIHAAHDILNEAPNVSNHAAREAWARAVLDNPAQQQQRIWSYALTNPALVNLFTTPEEEAWTDSDAQNIVNGIVGDAALLARIQGGE